MIPKSAVKKADFEIIGFRTTGINTTVYSSESKGVSVEVTEIYTGAYGEAHKIYFSFDGWNPPYKNFRPRLCHIKHNESVYIADIVKFSIEDLEFCVKPRN